MSLQQNHNSHHLFNDVSLWGVFKTSLPMMISALSSHIMLVLDQLILAYYSVESMTGATSAFLWSSIIQCIALSTTMVAGAFVGHYNGTQKYDQSGIPVWQMIWFSVSLFVISIPSSMFLGEYCIPEPLQKEGIPYFQCILMFAPITGIIYSISSFFVSIGRGITVTIAAILSNIFNIVVDIILVFGYFGIDQFQGSMGAAIGTVISWIVNIFILSCFYFRGDVRQKYGTCNFKFRPSIMKECLKLGASGGVGHTFEMVAWSSVYYLLAKIDTSLALIQTMAFDVNICLSFIASGLEKGIIAMTSNFLGSSRSEKIKTLLYKGLTIHLIFASILFFAFYIYPELITHQFIKFDVSPETLERAFFVLKLVWIFFVFDGALWVIAGIIEAGGDINFTMWSISGCLWIFVALPSIILSHFHLLGIEITWCLLIVSAISINILLHLRYRSQKWIKIKV